MTFLTPQVIRALAGLLLFGGVVQAAEKSKTQPLDEVITKAIEALNDYQTDATNSGGTLPTITSAEFDFKTVADKMTGVKVSLLVFTLGATKENQLTSDFDFVYMPHPSTSSSPNNESTSEKPHVPLVDALKASAKAATAAGAVAQQQDDPNDKHVKYLCKLTLVLAFSVTTDQTLGISGTYDLVTASGNFGHNTNNVQSVTLTFNVHAPTSCLAKN